MNNAGVEGIDAVHEPELARGLQQLSNGAAQELMVLRNSDKKSHDSFMLVIISLYLNLPTMSFALLFSSGKLQPRGPL